MDLNQISKAWKRVLLVDWPSIDIPRALTQGGFQVFSYSPGGYAEAVMEDLLIFRPVNMPTLPVEIIVIYRPAEEHEGIIKDHAIPLGAQVIWLQPPVESEITKQQAEQLSIMFIQGHDIRELIH